MEIRLIGNPISLKEKLGKSRYDDISRFFKRELGTTLEELEEGVKLIEPIYLTKMEMLSNSILGFYENDKKELWMVNFEDVGSLIHELTHIHQHRRKGVISGLKRKLSRIACRRILQEKGTFLYQIDFWEREANKMASKYLDK